VSGVKTVSLGRSRAIGIWLEEIYRTIQFSSERMFFNKWMRFDSGRAKAPVRNLAGL